MIKAIKQNKIMYLTVILALALISVGVISSSLLSLVAAALIAAAIVFLKPGDVIPILFACMPFANIFKLSPTSVSLFTVLELFAVAVLLFRCRRVKASALLCMMVLLVYMFLLSFGDMQIFTIVKVITGFLLIYFATFYAKKEDVKNMAYLLSFSVAAMLLLCQIPSFFDRLQPYFRDINYYSDGSGQASDVLRNSGFLGDPNYCAVLIVVTLALLCVLYYYKHIGLEFWVFGAILAPLGFLTYSKSYFLCIIMLVVFLILFVLFPKHKGWAVLSLVGLGVVISLTLSGRIEVLNMILIRFDGGLDLSSGRELLNQQYLSHIAQDFKVLMLGEGIGAERYAKTVNNVHNIYIELLFKMGIIGSVIYVATLMASFYRVTGAPKVRRKFANYMPAIFVALMFGFLAGVLNYSTPFYLILAYVALQYNSLPSDEEWDMGSEI